MERTRRDFPNAKYIHLLRHLRRFYESVLKSIRRNQENNPFTPGWLYYLATYPDEPTAELLHGNESTPLDPQRAWLGFQMNVCTFLQNVPEDRKLQIRGEELLTEPEKGLVRVANWLGLFCLPHAGGGASMYNTWHESLPGYIEVCAIELPGRESKLREQPFTQIGPLVNHLAELIQPVVDIPFAVFGHSMGALVSFEL